MNLRIVTNPKELREIYEADLKPAFPPEELKPLSAMERLTAQGCYITYVMEEDGQRMGAAQLWTGSDGYALLDYLAVSANQRNRGIGAELLGRVIEAYDGRVVIGEAEAPTGDPERDHLILRRLGFYERNNARCAGYDTALFGVRYRTIYWAAEPLSDEVLIRHHREIYESQFTPESFQRFLRIPAAEGEDIGPTVLYAEE